MPLRVAREPSAASRASRGSRSSRMSFRDSIAGREFNETDALLTESESDTDTDGYVQSRGVTRMEALHRTARSGRGSLLAVGISIVVCAWAYSLDQSTTYYYSVLASSHFKSHSALLATLSVSTNIISAVSKPFIAKISDITSRPYTYLVILAFYVSGYVIVAFSPTLGIYIFGEILAQIGSSGLNLLNEIIVGDLTPLEWRGFVGSMLSVPFLINTYFSGMIVEAFREGEKWRWGYGMFAIIMPIVLGPAIATLIYLDRRAQREGIVNMASSNAARRLARQRALSIGAEAPRGSVVAKAVDLELSWKQQLRQNLIEIDATGLTILALALALLLLPPSLRSNISGGIRNPVSIGLMCSGVAGLVGYVVYETKFAQFPSAPRRLLFNRTFLCAVIIDAVYFLAGMLRGLYFSSFVYVAKPWSEQEWVYFNNSMTISLTVFGILAGLLQRWTHRYRTMQICGLIVKIAGIAILLDVPARQVTSSSGLIIASQIMIGGGGAFSVVGSRVASQASVPHQELALVVALLSLWTKVGSSIGSAIAALVWTDFAPRYLRMYLPADTTEEQIQNYYKDIRAIRTLPFESEIRQGAITAYKRTLWHLIVPALLLSLIPLIAAFCQSDFYLGKQQNAVMPVVVVAADDEDEDEEPPAPPSTFKQKLLRFWAGESR